MPPNTVVVSRPSQWGNPFDWRTIQSEWGGTRAECQAEAAQLFDDAVHGRLENIEFEDPEAAAIYWPLYRNRIAELRGKNLACWCALPAPGEPDLCHAAVLLEIANAE